MHASVQAYRRAQTRWVEELGRLRQILLDSGLPEELQSKLDSDSEFRTAFGALTPGRQRGYLLHFAQPKHSRTRMERMEKCAARIKDGKGLRDCVCGHSKRYPTCDGSHKYVQSAGNDG